MSTRRIPNIIILPSHGHQAMQKKNTKDNSEEKDIAALADMALQHYREGDLQQAQDDCQRILRRQQRPDAILILAKIAHEQSEFQVAVERYQQFLKLFPIMNKPTLTWAWCLRNWDTQDVLSGITRNPSQSPPTMLRCIAV